MDGQSITIELGWLGHLAGDMLNVATTAGPVNAPTFVLYPFVHPVGGESFTTVAFSPPLLGASHLVHPVVLVVEFGILGGGLLTISGRKWVQFLRPGTSD